MEPVSLFNNSMNSCLNIMTKLLGQELVFFNTKNDFRIFTAV